MRVVKHAEKSVAFQPISEYRFPADVNSLTYRYALQTDKDLKTGGHTEKYG